ncbi:class I SAM-dependent methyltransferase [Actinoplanes sp. CA-030573]|uniref:class I SAM-dependent methyltransferase n=1 Tax=Actinoplanes sp. CA-030573 TaxID=3239898 RepID=UPI003D9380F9
MSSIINVFDQASSTYENVGVGFFGPIAAELVSAVAPGRGWRALDAGCGTGAVLLRVAEAVGPEGRVTGIDLAPGMVARARAAATGLDNVTVTTGDAQAPGFPDGSFDLITSGLVLFFLPDPPAALRSYGRLLKRGGRLGVSSFAQHDPRYPQAMKIIARFADAPPPPRKLHPIFESAGSLRTAVLEAGFTTVSVRDVEVASSFRDVAHLYEWIGSHGGRQLVSRVPQQRRAAAIAAMATEMPEPLDLTTRIRITVAEC